MTDLDAYFGIGVTMVLGSHTFEPEAIKAFARKYDPQPFHLDETAAAASVLKGLCASGWHTAAVWMKCNLASRGSGVAWSGPGPEPVFGPSPGFSNLKWPKPVFAGETVTYTSRGIAHRPIASRPGWRILTGRAGGTDSTGATVIEFDSAVLVQMR